MPALLLPVSESIQTVQESTLRIPLSFIWFHFHWIFCSLLLAFGQEGTSGLA